MDDYEQLTLDAQGNCEAYASFSEQSKLVILIPVLPRDFAREYYPQGINQYSLDPSTPDFYYRPDIKVNAIIDRFSRELNKAGYLVQDKVFVSGFSAGGMWANRYTLLHPERVRAAAIGQAGGWLAMPVNSLNGTDLNWPMGLSNYEALTGEPYDKYEILKSVPMFIYIGDQDTNIYCGQYPRCDLIAIWGNNNQARLKNQYDYFQSHGYDVSFKLYSNVAHSYTGEMFDDAMRFLQKHR